MNRDVSVLRAEGLGHRYGARVVLEGVNLAVAPGGITLVSGRSGSGKSTLLSLLAGLETPTSGVVKVGDRVLSSMDAAARTRFRLTGIGIVFQDFRLIPDLTAAENVQLPVKLAGRKGARERAHQLLDSLGLGMREDAFPETLSGGEAQRVAIARALANNPSVVLADEPTANLDEENAHQVLGSLQRVAGQGKAVLLASHDALARSYARQRYRLVAGRLLPGEA